MGNFLLCDKDNYKSGRSQAIKYIVIHYTGNNGDTAKGNANYFAKNKVGASAHYFVDEVEVWQSVREGDTAYHCGAKKYMHKECRNNNSLGIELCSRKDNKGNYYFKQETIDNAIKLVRELMSKYKIPISNVIRHYDVTGKNCPAPFVQNNIAWDKFKDDLLVEKEDGSMKITQVPVKYTKKGYTEEINAVNIEGNNFVKVRDICHVLGFDVDYVNGVMVIKE